MKALTAPMQQLGEFEEILRKIRTNRGVLQVSGCIDPQKLHFISRQRGMIVGLSRATVICVRVSCTKTIVSLTGMSSIFRQRI